jgi:hypothetical protein
VRLEAAAAERARLQVDAAITELIDWCAVNWSDVERALWDR